MNLFIGRKQKRGTNPLHPVYPLAILTSIISVYLAACAAQPASQSATSVSLSPASTQEIPLIASGATCSSPHAPLTVALTEGPYFKAGSPESASLVGAGMKGTKLILSGYVLTADCKPVAHALLDFWQANADGQYDISGYSLRGHQFTDSDGYYQVTTIIPGLYPGRTEHIHVKVQAPGGPVLTTQLFFPGVTQNQSDGIFDPSLLLSIQSNSDGDTAVFNFVVSPE